MAEPQISVFFQIFQVLKQSLVLFLRTAGVQRRFGSEQSFKYASSVVAQGEEKSARRSFECLAFPMGNFGKA